MNLTPYNVPCGTISPGRRLDLMESPRVGQVVVIYAQGRFRKAIVTKVMPMRVQVALTTPSNPREVKLKLRRRTDGRWVGRVLAPSAGGAYRVSSDPDHPRYGHDLVYHATGEQAR